MAFCRLTCESKRIPFPYTGLYPSSCSYSSHTHTFVHLKPQKTIGECLKEVRRKREKRECCILGYLVGPFFTAPQAFTLYTPGTVKLFFFLMFYLFQLSWNKKEMLKKERKFCLILSYNHTPFGNQYREFGSCASLLHLSTLSSLLYTVLCSQRGLTLCSALMSILILHLLGWFGQRQIKKRLENNRKEIFISDTLFSNGCIQSHRSYPATFLCSYMYQQEVW